jgi:hypothetical protein
MRMKLLTNHLNYGLQSIDSLRSESNPAVDIGSVEVLMQRCVEAL